MNGLLAGIATCYYMIGLQYGLNASPRNSEITCEVDIMKMDIRPSTREFRKTAAIASAALVLPFLILESVI